MILIIGLGNPGPTYQKTRHNLGFRVVDALAEELDLKFSSQKKLFAKVAKNSDLILAKPQTFMNDSGKAVQKLLTTYLPSRQAGNLQLTNLIVIHDEIDLPLGKIRVSKHSGSAGHKGVESIITAIGTGFMKLRIGIENREEYRQPDTETYVLQNFTPEEEKELQINVIPEAIKRLTEVWKLEIRN